MKKRILGFSVCLLAGLVSVDADATVTTFSSETTFATTTGSTLQAVPTANGASSITTTGGVLEIRGVGQYTTMYSNGYSGLNQLNYIGKTGNEDFDILAKTTIYGFGLSIYEPNTTAATGCNWECSDTTFSLTLYSGSTNIGSYTINPVDVTFDFYGYWSSDPITKIEIRDVTATVDNEFIGRFFTTTRAYVPPATSVPEPGALALLGLGLAGLEVSRRRN